MSSNQIVSHAVKKFGIGREQLLPVLQYVVSQEKWLSGDALLEVARAFDMSAAEVYGVASFYSFLDTEPRGDYVIRVCRTISCDTAGKEAIMEALEKTLRISVGETTADRKFTLLETNCMGWCAEGPAMLVNNDVHTGLTPEKVVDILQGYMEKSIT
ncbi:NADH-quinone oxidoreductase subunit NuoE [Syntrophorhabdus aromaticivorans]|jgi:NADH:ubiquinone oxidoreductase subunit E|uniref:NADH-quinone oxidoreductase subunit NuoE n=1 Tax=Syntrophorhabdus aromaticivorans TaxID=328301 RepID=A0A351U3H4_9BACT|nr:NADH-quinone oxidoreductase subunit NuoE [Syntrophorhabdus aromaticivorans]NLW35352.1 NADH-quinone oxidoreductase subunit NuoE [Syntrophorhabdus aromaticivorans]HBA54505.1 NADH-quinone oxidoreductase subunit NuoE [Syntrophorhabdus aromaticivorans]